MPVPVFVSLSHLRIASAISVANFAEKLGISSSFLFYLEEFEKTVDFNMQTKGKRWGEKSTLGMRLAEWLQANPTPSAFTISISELPHLLAFESLYLSLWPHINKLFNPSESRFFYFFQDHIFWDRITKQNPLYDYDEGNVIAPSDMEIARGLYWLLSRKWGTLATSRRHDVKGVDVIFEPHYENIFSVQPGEYLGRLKIRSIRHNDVFKSFAHLLFFLYISKIYILPQKRTKPIRDKWQQWTKDWCKRTESPSGLDKDSYFRDLIWLSMPPDAPPAQLVFVLCTPYGPMSVFFESLHSDDPSPYSSIIGFYVIKGDVGINQNG